MRKCVALALLVTFSWIGGLGQDARAGVTIDVVFQDATSPSGITINAGDWGVGCAFGGYYGGYISTAYCMDVMMTTTWSLETVSVSVAYDNDNGLQVEQINEWQGLVTLPRKTPGWCAPVDGVADNGGIIQHFDCTIVNSPIYYPVSPGTYKLGTIVWDTSGTTAGAEVIQAVLAGGDGVTAVINGNVVDVTSSVVLRSHILNIIPEPGTAALLGLGLVGLTLAARRRLK